MSPGSESPVRRTAGRRMPVCGRSRRPHPRPPTPSPPGRAGVRGRVGANIAKVTAPAERDRWQANVELWTVATRVKLDFRAGDDIKLRGPFERMKLNVAAITEPGEQARWTANRDLWQVMVNRASATRVDPVIAPHNP